MSKHIPGPVCPSCEEKIASAEHRLQDWFDVIKAKYPDVHIAWAYRDQASQDEAFKSGASKLVFPLSAHNKKPSRALDLFQLSPTGQAIFDPIAMARIYFEAGKWLKWGGNFRTLGDAGHFELPADVEPIKKA